MVVEKICFVICPIGEEGSPIRNHSDLTLNYIINPVVEMFGYKPLRADHINEPGKITNQIIDQIVESSLVIADLTDYNPNVFYELAIRHIVKKPYIQMMRSDQKVPFDIYDVRTIPFDINIEQATKAKQMLNDQIEAIENDNFKPHNVITSAKNYSSIKKIVDEGGQIEFGNLSQVFLNYFSEFSSMMNEMKSEIYELKTSLNRPIFANDNTFKQISNVEYNQELLKKLDLINKRASP